MVTVKSPSNLKRKKKDSQCFLLQSFLIQKKTWNPIWTSLGYNMKISFLSIFQKKKLFEYIMILSRYTLSSEYENVSLGR